MTTDKGRIVPLSTSSEQPAKLVRASAESAMRTDAEPVMAPATHSSGSIFVPRLPENWANLPITNSRRAAIVRSNKKRAEKHDTHIAWVTAGKPIPDFSRPVHVRFVLLRERLYPSDDDNFKIRFKHMRDAICRAWRIDDGDQRLVFDAPQQEKSTSYVGVRIEWNGD